MGARLSPRSLEMDEARRGWPVKPGHDGELLSAVGLLIRVGFPFRKQRERIIIRLRQSLFANVFAMGANDHLAILFGRQAGAGGFCGALLHGRLQSNAFDRADLGKGGVAEDEAGFGDFSGWALLLWHPQNLSHFLLLRHVTAGGVAGGANSSPFTRRRVFAARTPAKLLYCARRAGWSMKRYLIFAVLGPFLGGFLLLVVTTLMSGYWDEPSFSQFTKLLAVFARTLQYSYLFGVLPLLMVGAVDDILFHVKRIGPVVRMLIVGAITFVAAEFLYGSRGSDSGVTQFILYGLVGFVPATVSSWLAHLAIDKQAAA
jgi:Family of unknown function (DUF5413)